MLSDSVLACIGNHLEIALFVRVIAHALGKREGNREVMVLVILVARPIIRCFGANGCFVPITLASALCFTLAPLCSTLTTPGACCRCR